MSSTNGEHARVLLQLQHERDDALRELSLRDQLIDELGAANAKLHKHLVLIKRKYDAAKARPAPGASWARRSGPHLSASPTGRGSMSAFHSARPN